MIRLEHVTKRFSDTDTEVFRDLSFYLAPGELCFLRGASGCGKTTLLRLLLGELTADEGTVTVGGKDLGRLSHRELPFYRRGIGFVFQDYRLLEDRNVFQNVALTRYATGTAGRDLTLQVAHALRMVGMEDAFLRRPDELSGGEMQRVAIARALVGNPVLLLADEPTGNLDPMNSREVMELLATIHRKQNMTMVIATHDGAAIEGIQGKIFDMEHCRWA